MGCGAGTRSLTAGREAWWLESLTRAESVAFKLRLTQTSDPQAQQERAPRAYPFLLHLLSSQEKGKSLPEASAFAARTQCWSLLQPHGQTLCSGGVSQKKSRNEAA